MDIFLIQLHKQTLNSDFIPVLAKKKVEIVNSRIQPRSKHIQKSYFCQTLFEGKFAITPEEATIRKLPV